MNQKDNIKRFSFMDFFFGDPDNFTLQHRFFNLITLLSGTFSFVSMFQNFMLNLHIVAKLNTIVTAVILWTIYYFSRWRISYRKLVWVFVFSTMLLCSIMWFFNGGSQDGILYIYLVLTFYDVVITEGKERIVTVILMILNPIVLFILEYLFPQWMSYYTDKATQFLDMGITYTLCSSLMILGIALVMKNYFHERRKVEKQADLLRQEESKLRFQNEEMEKELQIARKIQMQFIPSTKPLPNISFYYKPMEQVGGDFFDFIEYPSGKIGIFLSDVSGHGVAAAFITSMIKSITLQFAGVIDNPAEFLSHLNDTLINQTAGNFITAFYGIYDQDTRQFVYANAGHNPPYIIQDNEIRPLPLNNPGMPLVVLNNQEIGSLNKSYRNHSIVLEKGSKLFLYTDGLTEAVNIKQKSGSATPDIPDFETKGIFPALKRYRKQPADEFVQSLVHTLVKFRGGNEFDDDVCMICIDIV